eukprot:14578741-Ditylum_brightwellii.AAC.1
MTGITNGGKGMEDGSQLGEADKDNVSVSQNTTITGITNGVADHTLEERALQKEDTDEQTDVQEAAGSKEVNEGINSVGTNVEDSKADHPRQPKE